MGDQTQVEGPALDRYGRPTVPVGSDPVEVGDTVPAYVLKVRPDSRLDICFRPVDPARRLHEAAAAVLAGLVDAAERSEPLPLGDDSEPRAVRRLFPGLSKSGFKARPL